MEFGMPVLLELDSLKENASLCRELGLSFIELNMNLPEYQLKQLDVRRMQRISKEYGLFFTLHLDENLNVWDFNPKVAEAYMDTILSALRFAGKMGNIPVLNMHMAKGVSFTLPEGKVYLFEKYRGKYLENLKNFRCQCEKAASGQSIKICIENTDGYPSFLLDAISYLLESPLFALTWDVGHDHASGGKDEEFLLSHWDKLAHFHLHDAVRGENHLPIGQGEIDWREKLGMAELCDARCVVEVKTAASLRQSVDYLKGEMEICLNGTC